MSRPKKRTLDYYPKDTDQNSDPKIQYLMAVLKPSGKNMAALGKHVYNTILDHIYGRDGGYYILFGQRRKMLFCDEEELEMSFVDRVLKICLDEGLFDKDLYLKFSILTSQSIQERFLKAASSRTEIKIEEKLRLLDHDEIKSIVNKRTRVKIISDDGTEVEEGGRRSGKIEYRENVHMTEKEYDKLVEEYGPGTTKALLDKLNHHKRANGKEYESDYDAIKNWVVDAVVKEHSNGAPTDDTYDPPAGFDPTSIEQTQKHYASNPN